MNATATASTTSWPPWCLALEWLCRHIPGGGPVLPDVREAVGKKTFAETLDYIGACLVQGIDPLRGRR